MESPIKSPSADHQWQAVQKKTFTKWINTKLATKGLPECQDVTLDFTTGVPLIQLLEIIGEESIPKYNKSPKMRIQRVENVNKALEFIKYRGVPLTNIGAEDIVDGNEKLILGMLWIIILRFTIAEISEGDLSAKEGLLLWCQKKTAGYRDVQVKDFTFSWQDGLAFCALIHRHRPDLIDFDSLTKGSKAANLEKAFSVAENELNIPRLLDVEDIVDVAKPDERSIMTYVAQYFHAFSTASKVETASRRVAKFASVLQSVYEMKHDYETRAAKLMDSMAQVMVDWKAAALDGSYAEVRAQLTSFHDYKGGMKRTWISERRDLEALLGNIQTKAKTYHMNVYVPPESVSLATLGSRWQGLVDAEAARMLSLSRQMKEIKERLRVQFAELANQFQDDLNAHSAALSALDGELQAQMDTVQSITAQLNELSHRIPALKSANDACLKASIEDNDHTIYSLDDLIYEFGLTLQTAQKKLLFIENQKVARSMTNVTPQQLEEFESTFHHFDRDNSNTLSKVELKASLAGLGNAMGDAEFDKVFSRLANERDEVSFEKFVSYMVSLTEDTTSVEQLRESFRALSTDADVLTVSDLSSKLGAFDKSSLDFLLKTLPKKDAHGLDYEQFLTDMFSS